MAQANGQGASLALTNNANSFTPQDSLTFIGNVYENLFDRAAESGGLPYSTSQIENGAVGLGATVLVIANGAQGGDSILLQNKITVASDFTKLTSAANVPTTSAFHAEAKAVLAARRELSPPQT